MRIKVLHITSSLKIGGAEAVLCDLVKNLDTNRFEHHVIYFHEGPHLATIQKLGVATYHVQGLVSLYDPFFLIRLYRTVKKINPDLVHTLLWAANVSGRLVGTWLKIPVISSFHNNVDQDGSFRAFFDRATLTLAKQLIAVSDGVAQSVQLRDPWLQAPRLEVIPNGIDIVALHDKNRLEAISRSELGLQVDDFIIGSVGRFVPVKRYDLLINAFMQIYAQNPRVKLVLVGSGPLEDALKKQAQAREVSHAVLFIVGQPAYRYYSMFDCFVQSSDKEGISIALLEAMSFGLPSVVTNENYAHSVIKHMADGIVVPAGDKDALAHAIIKIMDKAALQAQLSYAARRKVAESFSINRMIEQYTKIFNAHHRNSFSNNTAF